MKTTTKDPTTISTFSMPYSKLQKINMFCVDNKLNKSRLIEFAVLRFIEDYVCDVIDCIPEEVKLKYAREYEK